MKDSNLSLDERINAASKRIMNGQASMRIPAEATDPDVVLSDCQDELARLRAELERASRIFEETNAFWHEAEHERDEARAEVERLKAELEAEYELSPKWRALQAERDALKAELEMAMHYRDDFRNQAKELHSLLFAARSETRRETQEGIALWLENQTWHEIPSDPSALAMEIRALSTPAPKEPDGPR